MSSTFSYYWIFLLAYKHSLFPPVFKQNKTSLDLTPPSAIPHIPASLYRHLVGFGFPLSWSCSGQDYQTPRFAKSVVTHVFLRSIFSVDHSIPFIHHLLPWLLWQHALPVSCSFFPLTLKCQSAQGSGPGLNFSSSLFLLSSSNPMVEISSLWKFILSALTFLLSYRFTYLDGNLTLLYLSNK